MSLRALTEDRRRLIIGMVQAIDNAVAGMTSGRLRRRGVRLRLGRVRPPTGLAKYCSRENRKPCEEALRYIGLFFSQSSIEQAIRWASNNGALPEVVIAYLYALILVIMGGELSKERAESINKVRIDIEHFALDLTPVGSEFNITDARNIIPGLRIKGF